jgi:hypothetical protein
LNYIDKGDEHMILKKYTGWLIEGSNGHEDDILYLINTNHFNEIISKQVANKLIDDDDDDKFDFDDNGYEPFAEVLRYAISYKNISVSYYICDNEITEDEAMEQFLGYLDGAFSADYGVHWSEMTGYLWTDEDIKVGGHDLLRELKSNLNKYLIMTIEVADDERIRKIDEEIKNTERQIDNYKKRIKKLKQQKQDIIDGKTVNS